MFNLTLKTSLNHEPNTVEYLNLLEVKGAKEKNAKIGISGASAHIPRGVRVTLLGENGL